MKTHYRWELIKGCIPKSTGCKNCIYKGEMTFNYHPLETDKPHIHVAPSSDLMLASKGFILQVIEEIRKFPEKIFQVLTKHPEKLAQFVWPHNVSVGTSVENQSMVHRVDELRKLPNQKFISFAPLLEEVNVNLDDITWIVISPEKAKNPRPCSRDWIYNLIYQAWSRGIPVNLNWLNSVINQWAYPNFDSAKISSGDSMHFLDGNKLAYVVPYSPLWGPDAGRRYILYCFQYDEEDATKVFQFDIERQVFTELNLEPRQLKAICHSASRGRTALVTDAEEALCEFENTEHYDGLTVKANVEFMPFNADNRFIEKEFHNIRVAPAEAEDLELNLGLNGYPPIVEHAFEDNHYQVNLDKMTGFNLHVNLIKSGGGKILSSGLTVSAEEKPSRKGRSYRASKKEIIEKLWALQPPYICGRQLISSNNPASVNISHSLSRIPKAVIVSPEGWTMTSKLLVDYTSFDGIIQVANTTGATIGDYINWVAFIDDCDLIDGGISSGYVRVWRSLTQPHTLFKDPDVVLFSATTAGTACLGIQGRQNYLNFILEDESDEIPTIWAALKESALFNYFSCGTGDGSGGGTQTISHGLGQTPSAFIVCQNEYATVNSSWGSHGISSLNSTQVQFTCDGEYHWAAFT